MSKYSFPSIHATVAFAFATTIIFTQYESTGLTRWLLVSAVLLFILAKAISISRIMVGVHYYFDILVGGILGIAVGCAALLL